MMGITPTAILVLVAALLALAPPLPVADAEAPPAELLVPPHPARAAPVTIASTPRNARRREGLSAMSPPGGMRYRARRSERVGRRVSSRSRPTERGAVVTRWPWSRGCHGHAVTLGAATQREKYSNAAKSIF